MVQEAELHVNTQQCDTSLVILYWRPTFAAVLYIDHKVGKKRPEVKNLSPNVTCSSSNESDLQVLWYTHEENSEAEQQAQMSH
jgi:hypothetical protein